MKKIGQYYLLLFLFLICPGLSSSEDFTTQKNPIYKFEQNTPNQISSEAISDIMLDPSFFGFFDINFVKGRVNPWNIGPVELDLEYYYDENFAVAGALVFEDGAADVGVVFIDFHSFDNSVSPRGQIFYEPGVHLQLGRFDIPFGLDYLYFATPDRETITVPLITDHIMDGGWNSDGLRVYGTLKFLDFSVYTTNGFDKGIALGGRLNFFPLRDPFRLHKEITDKLFEIGVSYAVNNSNELFSKDGTIMGFDMQFTINHLEIRGEFLEREDNINNVTKSGFYTAAKYSFDSFPIYSIINYGEFTKDGSDKIKRIIFGLTYEVMDVAAIKAEYTKFLDSDLTILEGDVHDNLFSAKLVLSF